MTPSQSNLQSSAPNPADELAFIRKVMQDSRRTAVDNGMNYIFWGVWAALGAIASYISSVYQWKIGLYLWGGVISLGWVISWFIVRRGRWKAGTTSLASNVLSAVWFGCGVAMSLIGFVGGMTVLGNGITGVLSIIAGTGFYISGLVSGSSWLRYYAAIGWWLGGVLMFCFPGRHVMLMLAVEMLLFQLVPGIILYQRWKSEQHEA